jgi:hypothetical protein
MQIEEPSAHDDVLDIIQSFSSLQVLLLSIPTLAESLTQQLDEQLRKSVPDCRADEVFIRDLETSTRRTLSQLALAAMGRKHLLPLDEQRYHVEPCATGHTFGVREMSRLIAQALDSLEDRYPANLNAFWSGPTPDIGSPRTGSCHEVLVALQRDAALAQVKWLYKYHKVSSEQATQLTTLLNAKDGTGCYNVLISSSRRVIRLPVDVLISPAVVSGSPDFRAWLVAADTGLVSFGSQRALQEEMARRMRDPAKREALVSQLPLAEQAALQAEGGLWQPERFSLQLCNESLFEQRVGRLRGQQSAEITFLMRNLQSQPMDEPDLLASLEHIRQLLGFGLAQTKQLEQLLEQDRQIRQPQWWVSAEPDEQAEFSRRGTVLASNLRAMDSLMADLATHEIFARKLLRSELEAYEIALDSDKVVVKVFYEFEFNDRFLEVRKDMTLVQLALNDLYDREALARTTLTLCESDEAAGLTAAIVLKIVERTNVRGNYPIWLEARHAVPSVKDARQAVLDSRLALSLMAARMQGSLEPKTVSMIDGLRERPVRLQSQGVGIHRVEFGSGAIVLADVIVLSYPDTGGDSFILYAPDSPTGQDVMKFLNVQQLRNEIGRWTASKRGRRYLLGQTRYTLRKELSGWLDQVSVAPHLITRESLRISAAATEAWADMLSSVCQRQTEHDMSELNALTPDWYLKSSIDSRRNLNRYDAELDALRWEYAKISDIPTFFEYSQAELQRGLNDYFPAYRARVYVDEHRMEISPGQWMNLVNVAMRGADLGVDVSRLRVSGSISFERREVIADAMAKFLSARDLPTDYARMMRSAFLQKDSPDREWRLDLQLRISQLEMQRARLVASLDKSIDPQRNVFLMQLANNLDRLAPTYWQPDLPYFGGPILPDGALHSSGLYSLGVKGGQVQGVYVVREVGDDGITDTLYTPHAPDGVWFRDISQIGAAIEHGGLGPYLRERVSFDHRERFDRFLVKLENDGYSASFTRTRVGPFRRVTNFRAEYDVLIRGILEDVDASTLSKSERLSSFIIEKAIQVISIAVLPFPPARAIFAGFMIVRSLYFAVQAYQKGDRAEALWHLVDATLTVASATGVSGKPEKALLENLFKGKPPLLAKQMASKLSGELTDRMDSYLKSISIPEKDPRYLIR